MYWQIRLLLVQPGTLIALAAAVIMAIPITRLITRLSRRPWWLIGLMVGAVGVILVATLGPDSFQDETIGSRGCLRRLVDFSGDLTGIFSGVLTDALPNVILYVPAGVLVALVTRRPVLTLLGLIALSGGIELVQPYIARACTSADWMSNSAGAFLGVAAAVVTLVVRRIAMRNIRARP